MDDELDGSGAGGADDAGPSWSSIPQWAVEVVHSVTFCRTASRVTAVLAGVGGLAGVAAAVLYLLQDRSVDSELLDVQSVSFTWGPALSMLLQTAFYAGLLLTASALLRLQASRLESEVFGDELDDED